MKNKWFSFLFVMLLLMLSVANLHAQVVLHGRVREIVEPYALVPLSRVEIVVAGAGSTTTDTAGYFHLTFPLGKVGDKVKVRNLSLTGYELVSSFFMDQWYVSLNDTMEIYMARQESFKRLRDQFCCHNSESYRLQQAYLDSLEVAFNDSCILKVQHYRDSLKGMYEEHLTEMQTVKPYLKQFKTVDVRAVRESGDIDDLLKTLNQQQAEADRLQQAAGTLLGEESNDYMR